MKLTWSDLSPSSIDGDMGRQFKGFGSFLSIFVNSQDKIYDMEIVKTKLYEISNSLCGQNKLTSSRFDNSTKAVDPT